MFEMVFAESLNPEHELLRAGRLIDWDGLHEALSSYYSPLGRAGKPIRLMVGIHILKHRNNCSDERAVEELSRECLLAMLLRVQDLPERRDS
jgi:IS5 family transposase